ncbi:BgTH12-02001 [Blumeria graminis f. sp. triticale]|uniref:Pre-rRNA-processing protein RIX1 n=1 Tax=Blumeria graminis f. sp. triticale TaxID=1689686 RepID=A0A9W4D4H2_BLUGR|nr:BgTH12-02001 [Blumeria graminis f. sp. triticale]
MSFPPELRVLCNQLSSTHAANLPSLIPTLSEYIARCQDPLSCFTSKSHTKNTSVLVHKLKTQITALLQGKDPGEKLTAIVLIKAVVEVGGTEVLSSCEPWVKGLLALITKHDCIVLKEMCIATLTKIYILTHQSPSIVRELTTPTLPAYVSSCLEVITSWSIENTQEVPISLQESVIHSFALLVPHHNSLFRPFATQIRTSLNRLLTPSMLDIPPIPSSLKEGAQRLYIRLYQTAPKDNGREEWNNGIRKLIKNIHVTSDQVFRTVIEEWESNSGYIIGNINPNENLKGGDETVDYLNSWTGIEAGSDRLIGMIQLLTQFFLTETSWSVATPIGAIMDLVNRIISIKIPTNTSTSSNTQKNEAIRLNPNFEKEEQEILWTRMPYIYTSTIQLLDAIANRLQEHFTSIAFECFDRVAWIFPYGKDNSEFRLASFKFISRILKIVGKEFTDAQMSKAPIIINSCCQELLKNEVIPTSFDQTGVEPLARDVKYLDCKNSLLRLSNFTAQLDIKEPDVAKAASKLLPLLISNLPQNLLHISQRVSLERTAILAKNKDTLLASILYPFIGKCSKPMASIIPHLSREFPSEYVTEILLRPRMPLLLETERSSGENLEIDSEEEVMEFEREISEIRNTETFNTLSYSPRVSSMAKDEQQDKFDDMKFEAPTPTAPLLNKAMTGTPTDERKNTKTHIDSTMCVDSDSSDNESVHLCMQIDTDSDA